MSVDPHPAQEQKSTRPDPGVRERARQAPTRGEDPAPAPGHSPGHVPADFRQVNGWGADLDPKDRPSYPKEWPSTVMTARGDVTDWQIPTTKVHVSNEHPGITPVFGTACPPHGLSGLLRDYAFQFGEATNRHWMTLMLADRVDVIESMLIDTFRGEPDRYVKEKAWSAKLRYADPERRRRYAIVGAAILGSVALGLVLRSAFSDDE